MRVGKHTAFMIDFVCDFAGRKIPREAFEIDYSGYVIEHFPMMERENKRLAHKFADTVDDAVKYAESHTIDDEDYRIMINNTICDLLGVGEPDLL